MSLCSIRLALLLQSLNRFLYKYKKVCHQKLAVTENKRKIRLLTLVFPSEWQKRIKKDN